MPEYRLCTSSIFTASIHFFIAHILLRLSCEKQRPFCEINLDAKVASKRSNVLMWESPELVAAWHWYPPWSPSTTLWILAITLITLSSSNLRVHSLPSAEWIMSILLSVVKVMSPFVRIL